MRCLLLLISWFLLSATQAQNLMIGTTSEYPPLASLADQKNHFYGFETDIMEAICSRINATCHFTPVLVSNIVSNLSTGKIDMAIAAIIVPSHPLPGFVFSLPYLQSGAQFMTLKNSKINSPADIAHKLIGVRRGTLGGGNIFENLILKTYHNQLTVIEYLTMNDLLAGLSNQEIDAIFTNEVAIRYWYYNNRTIYKLIGNKILIGNGYGIMATEKYTSLMQQINQALLQMMTDGTYVRIYNNYFGD